jgi:lipase maturation factor 1
MAMGGIGGWCERGAEGRPTYRLIRSVLLRGLGVVYVSAFGSLAVQLDGLIGSRGILPAAEFLDRAGQVLGTGPATYWRLPTLFWLDASDRALHGVCWGGLGLGVLESRRGVRRISINPPSLLICPGESVQAVSVRRVINPTR